MGLKGTSFLPLPRDLLRFFCLPRAETPLPAVVLDAIAGIAPTGVRVVRLTAAAGRVRAVAAEEHLPVRFPGGIATDAAWVSGEHPA